MLTLPAPQPEVPLSDGDFARLCTFVRLQRGIDLERYKDKCIRRRIGIRVRASQAASGADYCQLLERDPQELDRLLKIITIHVTQFFRNASAFHRLRDDFLPELLRQAAAAGKRQLTFWSAGCATGEEPYSLAMVLLQAGGGEPPPLPVSIIASDIDQGVLDTALRGVYAAEQLAELSMEEQQRFFFPDGERFRLQPAVKNLVRFERRDILLGDYPACDLILCRNLLIYFDREEQEKVLRGFADALGPDGILVLGKSETLVGSVRQRFQTLCPLERIYRVRPAG